jgi:hypothetical protein
MWYKKVVKDLSELPAALDFYSNELVAASAETKIAGNLEKNAQELGGVMSYRFDQLQEIEAILKYLNIQYDRLRSGEYKKFTEHYNRDLADRAIEKYIDGVQDIVDMQVMINEVALIRNRYLAVIKGLDNKSYMLGHIVRLRCAGLEDIQMETKK